MKKQQGIKQAVKALAPSSAPNKEWGKVIALGTGAFVFNILLWILYRVVVQNGLSLTDGWSFLFGVLPSFLALFFAVASVGVLAYLVKDRSFTFLILGVLSLLPLAFYPFHVASLAAAALVFVGFAQYDFRIKNDVRQRLTFSVLATVRHGIDVAILCVLAAASLLFYAATNTGGTTNQSAIVPIAESAGNAANQLLALQVKGYDARETVDDFFIRMLGDLAKKQAEGKDISGGQEGFDLKNPSSIIDQLQTQGLADVYNNLPVEIRQQLQQDPESVRASLNAQLQQQLQTQVTDVRDQVLSGLKISANGATPIGDVIHSLVSREVEKMLQPIENLVPPLVSVALFLTLAIGGFIYTLATEALVMFLMWVLKETKFYTIVEENAKRQLVSLTTT